MIYIDGYDKTKYVMVYNRNTPVRVFELKADSVERFVADVTNVMTKFADTAGIPFKDLSAKPIMEIYE